MEDLPARLSQACDIIRDLGSAILAFSGGVDSTLLLALCLKVLGPQRVLAVTAHSDIHPQTQWRETQELARILGARHHLIETNELADPRFASNPPRRCYFCKLRLLNELANIARQEGFQSVVYGGNIDDMADYRPGIQAAQEKGARAPMLEAGLTKQHIRAASRELGLSTWDRPAMACLATRVPYGTALTADVLRRIELAEAFLRDEIGLCQFRLRHHPPVARLEIQPHDWERVLASGARERIVARLCGLGYLYVALDLSGFRSGSLNDALKP